MSNSQKVIVIGAGMAGSEAANFLANHGVEVILVENKTIQKNPAQKIDAFAELVCTNSLKSMNPASGHGLLKYEMDALGSIILDSARKHAVPAGDALAVDRDGFSGEVTDRLHKNENITIVAQDASDPQALMAEYQADACIIASGPLTTEGLSNWIVKNISNDDFYFYDAIAPVVDGDSLDYSKLYYKDRHKPVSEEEGEEADYLNAPMNQEQYEAFIAELVKAEKVAAQNFEDYKFFESCLPVDIMAERGVDTARFSCMKPIGLELPDGTLPYACVQLRRENLLGSAFNMVGFQTRLKYPEQTRVFKMIPGFENASFLHLGSVHRNSFINSRTLLDFDLSVKKFPNIYFAGQITGVEGYTESASMGQYVALQLLKKLRGEEVKQFPVETGLGALVNYIMTVPKPTPSNINFGLLPPVTLTKEQRRDRKNRKKVKKQLASDRAKLVFDEFMSGYFTK
ncbi:tRNA:m(5)U-54 methyltransferase [Bacteriovorax sp. BAL6_X]|uniref:methylenetetrahydrofolate--tRNA-(uracil(54)- C(5))-methyltransferase (FADH(2)-oxidizing) TrmFO n=1 Tax=Bacteriovorax sp. BAL6_X TaxID=1201290 RepID=UPI000386ECD3|nr:methylenetetrahydrofolate--tRNA-(uracil(54)-C(5))-methyltransferase (FADH(2)-oxidizing) TrmFO [Bacteriovorax sp. BAL6_X]EPZ51331.1 tRNA:m(5)U-54 methyltransferase [Bacteriovorax sp. BAL6_X]